MAQRRPEKRPVRPEFSQTKGEPNAETGLCLGRISLRISATFDAGCG
jgi:hypothetical protein